MHTKFLHITLVILVIQMGVIACAEEEEAYNYNLGPNHYAGGWTWAAGTVTSLSGWHAYEDQFSLEGDDTAAISAQIDYPPSSMDIVAELDDFVSLKVVVEGYLLNCGDVVVDPIVPDGEQFTVTYYELPASRGRVCPENICGTSDEDGYCLWHQFEMPLLFSDDGIAHLVLDDYGVAANLYRQAENSSADLVIVSIVKEGPGTALIERINLNRL